VAAFHILFLHCGPQGSGELSKGVALGTFTLTLDISPLSSYIDRRNEVNAVQLTSFLSGN